MRIRSALAVLALFLAGLASSCGGDNKEKNATFGGATQPTPNATTGKNSSGVEAPSTRAETETGG